MTTHASSYTGTGPTPSAAGPPRQPVCLTRRVPVHPVDQLLAHTSVLIIDGGLGTELEGRGTDLADPLWSARLLVDDPEAIVAAHLAFYRAGAQVATTASYQATFEGFGARGIDHDEAAGLMRRSVELASEARRRRRLEPGAASDLLVAASVGPYGAMLADGSEYRGDYGLGVDALREFHRGRFEVLASSGADLLALETIPSLDEGRALIELVDERPGVRAWLSFSCADGAHTRRGDPIEAAFRLAEDCPGIIAVGVNCTAPADVEELVQRAAGVTAKPIVVYPNGGERWQAGTRTWSGPADDLDPTAVAAWLTAGARIIGGCCRVGPGMIARIAAIAGAAVD